MGSMQRGRPRVAGILGALALLACRYVSADPAQPEVISPETLSWSGPPSIPELQAAWLIGSESEPAAYALRVRLRAAGRIPPHTHPDPRHTVVLSGVVYVGFGDRFDETAVVPVRAGEVYVTPAGVPHYVWARDGDVEYQENGRGPTATEFLAR